jgi:hypothetical protein
VIEPKDDVEFDLLVVGETLTASGIIKYENVAAAKWWPGAQASAAPLL